MPTPSKKKHIALVEDDPLMGSLVVHMLGLHDLLTDRYQSGCSFLRSSALQDYETAILDLSLPDIDGFDLISKLAGIAPHIDLVHQRARPCDPGGRAPGRRGIGSHRSGYPEQTLFPAKSCVLRSSSRQPLTTPRAVLLPSRTRSSARRRAACPAPRLREPSVHSCQLRGTENQAVTDGGVTPGVAGVRSRD